MLDVFNSNIFGVIALTDAIMKIPFVPGRIGQMGLFRDSGVALTTVAVEEKDGALVLVPPTPRGGPGITVDKTKRRIRNLTIPHFEINDAVMAEEVQGVRAFGTESQLMMLQDFVLERGEIHTISMAATEEYNRIGAIKRIVTYADGSTLDLCHEFNVTAPDTVYFDLENATPTAGALRAKCASVIRTIGNELGALPFNLVWAFCGDTFFDDLLKHPEVRATFLNWTDAQILREGYVGSLGAATGSSWGMFEFGGIVFENYRGVVNGVPFIDPNLCHIFPIGVPNLFRTVYGPADYIETVNTIGRRLYAKQYPMDNDKGINFDVQMNGLQYCTRPRALITGSKAAS